MSEKVLIVDDEKDFLDIIAERIRVRGMDVSTATSAEEALNMVEETSYDVIIMDFMIPGMNGLQTVKAIKEKKPEVQIILLTGNVFEAMHIEARKLGVLDVIEKPPDLNDLIGKIRNTKAQKTLRGKKRAKRK